MQRLEVDVERGRAQAELGGGLLTTVDPVQLMRFDGEIAGVGTASGSRIVLGLWRRTPFGPIADAMVEQADGHRVLIAPSDEVAEFIAATYVFDEIRVETTHTTSGPESRMFQSGSLQVGVEVGSRTAVGALLRLVPRPVARSRAWCRSIDPIARRLRPGVRTVGTAGGGRREYYCALDEHEVSAVRGTWQEGDLGRLQTVDPPVRFGFASTPARPTLVRVTTLVA